jgi:hypothetical protein
VAESGGFELTWKTTLGYQSGSRLNQFRLDTKKGEFYILWQRGAALALKPSATVAFGGGWRSLGSRFYD